MLVSQRRVAHPTAEPQAQARTVGRINEISLQGRRLRCLQAFVGRRLALRTTETDGVFDLCDRHHVLSQVDLRETSVKPVPEQVSTLSPV